MFITGGGVADVVVTLTRTGPGRYNGITSFLVDTSLTGFSSRPIKKLGYKGSDTSELIYEDVRVTSEDILGGEECLNKGWGQMVRLLNGERLALSGCALGIAESALAQALEHYKNRAPARRPGSGQSLEHRLAEMATELEAARRLAYHAAWLQTNGMECVKETSMSKFFCTETAKKNRCGRHGNHGPGRLSHGQRGSTAAPGRADTFHRRRHHPDTEKHRGQDHRHLGRGRIAPPEQLEGVIWTFCYPKKTE